MHLYFAFNPKTSEWVMRNNFTSPNAVTDTINADKQLVDFIPMQVFVQDHYWRFIKAAIDNACNNAEIAYKSERFVAQQAAATSKVLSPEEIERIRQEEQRKRDELLTEQNGEYQKEIDGINITLASYMEETAKITAAIDSIPKGPMSGENSNIAALTQKQSKYAQEIAGLIERRNFLEAQIVVRKEVSTTEKDISEVAGPSPTAINPQTGTLSIAQRLAVNAANKTTPQK